MAQDERFTPGSHTRGRDELLDAADRLEESDLNDFDSDYPLGSSPHPHQETGMVHGFLEQQLRARPLPTLLAAVATGWIVGKLLR